MKNSIELIAEERSRQFEVKGFDAKRDSRYKNAELVKAAVAYALDGTGDLSLIDTIKELWPWGEKNFKIRGRVEQLTVAGALIAAEIDRLQGTGP